MKRLFTSFLFLITIISFGGIKPEIVLTTGHSEQVNAMVTSPNGRFLASSGNDNVVKIWEIATTQEYRTLSGFDGSMMEMIFAKDNIHLAGNSSQGEIIVWNVLSGEQVFRSTGGKHGMSGIAFNNSGEKVIHVSGAHHTISVTNIKTAESNDTEIPSTALCVDTNKQIVYSLNHLGGLDYFDLRTESVVKTVQLFDEYKFAFSGLAMSKEGKYLSSVFVDDILRVYDTDKHKFVFESEVLPAKVRDLVFDAEKPYLYISDVAGKVSVWNYQKMKFIQDWQSDMYAAQTICGHPEGKILIMATVSQIQFYDVKRKKVFKKLIGKTAQVSWLAHEPEKDYLAVSTDDIRIQLWDLKLNKVVDQIRGFKPMEFSGDGKYLYYQNTTSAVGIYDLEKKEEVATLNTNYQVQMAMAVSEDGALLAGGGHMMTATIWDLETNEVKGTLIGHQGLITSIDFHPTLPLIVTSAYDQTTRVWDLNSFEEIMKFEDQTICVSEAKFSPDGKLLASAAWDRTIVVREVDGWAMRFKLEGHKNMINSIDFNAESNMLVSSAGNNAVGEFDNSMMSWDMQSGQNICRMSDHKTAIRKVLFDVTNGRVFSASQDGEIKYTDPSNCELIVTYVGTVEKEFAIYTPDNYYLSSRKALAGMAFRLNNRLVAFEQFDIYLNRPDIVAQRIGKTAPHIIKAYEYLHKKRMKKEGIEEGDINIDFAIPNIKLEKDVDLMTASETQKIWLTAWDDHYDIKQINVYVNDSPIFGEAGFVPRSKTKSIKKEFEIPLVLGSNRIQFSCVNSNGAESHYETFDLIREGDIKKHNLYIATIGVSKYQDERFNLTYPVKDANDMLFNLDQTDALYNKVFSEQLLDDAATVENFQKLESFFSNCTHEDVAIVFIAGHGVLDENFDYYFGTHDIDFEDPQKAGLAYSEIHKLLNSIKAYKKLLIMDTCHSGELDKDEVEEAPKVDVIDGDIKFRAGLTGVIKKEGVGFENSVGIVQEFFSDTRKGSGATVISSAGGAEYALESDEWENGLFTYAFLHGLKNPELVGDHNSVITVSEIRTYVYTTVAELSKGKQIPTAREENISQDYVIFGN